MTYFERDTNAESLLYNCLGCFSTVAQVISEIQNIRTPTDLINYNFTFNSSSVLPGQFQAFLISSEEFTLFVEKREIIYRDPSSPSETPLVSFGDKKVYPAKVTGLNLPLIKNSFYGNAPITVRWRDELIRHGSLPSSFDFQSGNFRPGFGEQILTDLQRPLRSVTVVTNNLGLPNLTVSSGESISNGLSGPLGRLMSIASYVDPELAKKYDASKSKKKKKSLNTQTYQDPPVYPAYTPYQNSGGY